MKNTVRTLFSLALAIALVPNRTSAQGDVRIDVKSGSIARLPLRCESLQGPASGNAFRISSRKASAVS